MLPLTFSISGTRHKQLVDLQVIVDLGLTRDSVLCAVLMLQVLSVLVTPTISPQELRVLRWTELGEILQVAKQSVSDCND